MNALIKMKDNIQGLINRYRKFIIGIYFFIKILLVLLSYWVFLLINYFNMTGEDISYSSPNISVALIISGLSLNIIMIIVFFIISWIMNIIIFKLTSFKYKNINLIDFLIYFLISLHLVLFRI